MPQRERRELCTISCRMFSTDKKIVILISGKGSNMAAILQAIRHGMIHAEASAVISSSFDADGLRLAAELGIRTIVLERQACSNREEYDNALRETLEKVGPDLIVLAGFMHILGPDLVRRFYGNILNIHPSLLPEYKGLNTHQRVLEAGRPQHGCSVHFVTEALDDGPVIMQARVDVLGSDTPQTLAARVLTNEHIIYPAAIALYCKDRLQLNGAACLLDGQPLENPLLRIDRRIGSTPFS